MDRREDKWLSLRTQVTPWQCDGMGHMNTRYIEGLFDDATASFVAMLTGNPQSLKAQAIGWADRKHGFEFLSEILAGDIVEVRSRLGRQGQTSITTLHEMSNAVTGECLAAAEIVTVCFDLTERRSRPLPPLEAEFHTEAETP